jgi:predicted alpha/beta hydrolase
VLISSATATPRKIYRGFAAYLAHRGCAVLTYDYRGIGCSRQRPRRDKKAKSLAAFKAWLGDRAALRILPCEGWIRSAN